MDDKTYTILRIQDSSPIKKVHIVFRETYDGDIIVGVCSNEERADDLAKAFRYGRVETYDVID
jgi:hypothetical protein